VIVSIAQYTIHNPMIQIVEKLVCALEFVLYNLSYSE